MSVEYLYEKKSDDDEYNEIWKALECEQSAFERILHNENKAFIMGRLFEAKYLTQKLRTEKISSSTSSTNSWNGKRKPSKSTPRKRRMPGRPKTLTSPRAALGLAPKAIPAIGSKIEGVISTAE
jgi:hypothetical protein